MSVFGGSTFNFSVGALSQCSYINNIDNGPHENRIQFPDDYDPNEEIDDGGRSWVHCNTKCGRINNHEDPEILFFLTSCFHVLCGPCKNECEASPEEAVCPVCNEPLVISADITYLDTCEPAVKAFLDDPFDRAVGILETTVDSFARQEQFYYDQLEGLQKVAAQLADEHIKVKAEKQAKDAELEKLEEKVKQQRHDVEILRQKKKRLELKIAQKSQTKTPRGTQHPGGSGSRRINQSGVGNFATPASIRPPPSQKSSSHRSGPRRLTKPSYGPNGEKLYIGALQKDGENFTTPSRMLPVPGASQVSRFSGNMLPPSATRSVNLRQSGGRGNVERTPGGGSVYSSAVRSGSQWSRRHY